MPSFCCVVNCGSRGERDLVSCFGIPTALNFRFVVEKNELSKLRREKWLAAIKRDDLTESKIKYAKVCSKHFISGKPSSLEDKDNPDWVPCLHMGYSSGPYIRKPSDVRRKLRVESRTCKKQKLHEEVATTLVSEELSTAQCLEDSEEKTKSCQTDVTMKNMNQLQDDYNFINEQFQSLQLKVDNLSLESFKNDDRKTKYYTGLANCKVFEALFESLKPFLQNHHNTALPAFQQLLLTFMKLRLNLDFKDLAYRFNISSTTAAAYFRNVVDVMYLHLKDVVFWPDREVLKKTLPTCFKESFHNQTTIIIDCFEIFIENPSNLLTAAQSWSNYKHHHTIKFLIGITPQGTVAYISEAWGGTASDKHITINSSFLKYLTANDVILADRGFLIKDYVEVLQAKVSIPAFTKGKNQLHPIEIEETRSLANVRIHVERVIGLIKNKYRILQDQIPISLVLSGGDTSGIDKIVWVCCALINLCPSIVPL